MRISWEQGQSDSTNEQRPPVPPGTYLAKVHSAEKTRGFQGGDTAKVVMEIDKGAFAGRWIFEYFDVFEGNDPEKAEKAARARRRLQILARCAGISGRDYDLAELVGAVVEIETKLVTNKDGAMRARVARFNPLPSVVRAAEQLDDNPISADNLPF